MILNKKDGMFTNMLEFSNYLERLADGKYVLKKYTRKRTNDQNAYYWALIEIIAKESGEDKDYIHGMLGMKFLVDRSKKMPFIRSTSSLTTVEFSEYIENIKNYMAGFGIILPSAEQRENL